MAELSEWLKLMLAEVARRREEAERARAARSEPAPAAPEPRASEGEAVLERADRMHG